jgi:DNA-binding MarR family transcriptional regulator
MQQKENDLPRMLTLIHQTISNILGLHKGRKNELSAIATSILYNAHIKKMQVTEIASLYGIKKSTASGYVDTLEKKGYVKRVKEPENRRNTYVVPTVKGEKWISIQEKNLSSYVEKHLTQLTPKEQEELIQLLTKFTKENKVRG